MRWAVDIESPERSICAAKFTDIAESSRARLPEPMPSESSTYRSPAEQSTVSSVSPEQHEPLPSAV